MFTTGTQKQIDAAMESLPKHKTVLSAYGNPYICTIENIVVGEPGTDGTIVVKLLGVAKRDRTGKIVTDGGKKRKLDESLPELKGWRAITSHFSTGRCAACGESIHVGDPIAKRGKAETRG